MKIAAIKSEHTYILKSEQEQPADQQTRWVFKSPTLQDRIDFDSALKMTGQSILLSHGDILRRNCCLLRSTLIRIENFSDDSGTPVSWPVKTDLVAQNSILERMTKETLQELADQIINSAILPLDEKKS